MIYQILCEIEHEDCKPNHDLYSATVSQLDMLPALSYRSLRIEAYRIRYAD